MNLSHILNYKTTLSVVSITLVVPVIFFATTTQMIHVWNVNETFTHGYLIFPISFWLIWSKRQQLSLHSIEPELRPLLLLVMTLVVWFLGRTVDVQVVQQLAMIGAIPIIVWLLLGRSILLVTLFPIGYLFFAVPIGQGLIPPMMDFTADFTVFLIKLSGIPIYRDGLFFTLPSGNWSVVEECSGVRYLIASLALGTIYAYISYQSLRKRILFILVAAVVPVIANGIRAYGIVMIGHLSGMELATGLDHLVYGWVFFGVIIFAMFYLGSYWSDPVTGPQNISETTRALLLPEKRQRLLITIVMALVSIIGVKSIAYRVTNPNMAPVELASFTLPKNFEAWQQLEGVNIGWGPIFQSPDITRESAYRFGNEIVQVNIGYYSHQHQGAEAVSTQSRLVNPLSGRWKLTRRVDLQLDDLYVTESEIRRGDGKILVWHWYQLGDKQTPNRYIAKMFEAFNKIAYGRHDAAMITVATRLNDLEEGRSHLQSFVQASLNEISSKLEAVSK